MIYYKITTSPCVRFTRCAESKKKERGMGDYKKLPVQQLASLKPEASAEDSYWRSFVQVISIFLHVFLLFLFKKISTLSLCR
jgi:hypothetical protein